MPKPKELMIVKLIALGLPLSEISARAQYTERSTQSRKVRINRKLGTHNDVGMVAAAINRGWVTTEEILAEASDPQRLDPSRVESLTLREMEVLEPVAYEGLIGKQLGARFELNSFDVSFFCGMILGKLGVQEMATAGVLLRLYNSTNKDKQGRRKGASKPTAGRSIDTDLLLPSQEAFAAVLSQQRALFPEEGEVFPEEA